MTLDEAINKISEYVNREDFYQVRSETQAMVIGIEALKVIRDVRPTDYGAIDDPLPGED